VISAADGLEVWAGRELNLDQILDWIRICVSVINANQQTSG
jgi:hypothetical protein